MSIIIPLQDLDPDVQDALLARCTEQGKSLSELVKETLGFKLISIPRQPDGLARKPAPTIKP